MCAMVGVGWFDIGDGGRSNSVKAECVGGGQAAG